MITTNQGMDLLIERLKKDQSLDGSWNYPFETGLTTDIYMIVLLRTLEINDENLIKGLAERIISKQEKNGAWKLFHDEGDGNLSTSTEAYYALVYSGYFKKEDPRLQAAQKFISANGGIEKTSIFTKTMLSLTGQYKQPLFIPIPIELILLPLTYPINFYQFSVYGRSNLAPIMIIADKQFSKKTEKSPDLSELYTHREYGQDSWQRSPEMKSLLTYLKDGVENLIGTPERLHLLAIDRAKKYMLDHIEPDGTLYSYFSSTFLMIFALLALGHAKNDPVITKAVNGLKSMKTEINGRPHIQYTTASVWNTSLISFVLQLAGVSQQSSMVEKANHYLLEHQHHKFGDWVIHNPNSKPGGWGFSTINTINPDVDDTTASLRAIARGVRTNHTSGNEAWERGIKWLLSMQNDDGGWAGFEKNTNNKLLKRLPIEKGEFLLIDPSCADITGRTLEFFGNFTNISKNNQSIKNGIEWLYKNQEKDGSWYGRWGICYIYGTWGAVTGLTATGISPSHPSLQRAVTWLKGIQNEDGGWGESCHSDIQRKYIPLHTSTLTQTSWALDALIAASPKPTKEIQKGISYLLASLEKDDWTTDYPKGQGMAGGFYIHYHSYRYIFPLLTLAQYKNKFER
ncbi:squalene--hopene cyclase [Neobacillus sp. PS3-40]|uniref:squalene--hopene cyclase n=1 Tax=Neobacillus sp. PS3-40 TaxID=3070679 RepID=UPI0027E05157|nr:squalene--hopene cyclase [Neobacillus sp. PS3-40]WML44763.1 squalene--hopene cyclase [Neobacillus sp. PS3-40]